MSLGSDRIVEHRRVQRAPPPPPLTAPPSHPPPRSGPAQVHLVLSSLKGWGVVKGVLSCFDLDVDSAEPTPVSRWSARSAARTNDLDDGAERCSASFGWSRSQMGIGYVVVVQRLHSDAHGLGAGPNLRLPVIPSPRKRGMERCACNTRGQSVQRPRRDPGVRLLGGRARVASEMLTPPPDGGPPRGCVRRAARSRRG